MTAWTELSDAEHVEVWDRFRTRLAFKPSVQAAEWPGIHEQAPFVTWAIPDPWSEPEIDDLHQRALAAFRGALPPGERMYALDWQHRSWWLRPHSTIDRWEVPALPNGDYFIFLAPELNWGWFGHPWEQSICVFGERLLPELAARPPELFRRVLRRSEAR